MTKRGAAALLISLVLLTVMRVFKLSDVAILVAFILIALIAILDYYWLGGKLSGRSYSRGKK